MAVIDQFINDEYALYNSDCMEVMDNMKDDSIHFTIYSPPFCGLYQYSSNERDLSNCDSYESFFEHYEFIVSEIARLTMAGRCTAVHCMDLPKSNSGTDIMTDFPGDIIRLHEKHGFGYIARHAVWKEPLQVRLRTMQKNLAHQTLVEDSINCGVASADYLLIFRKNGENKIPVTHHQGLSEYCGEREVPQELLTYLGWDGKQTENRLSHWIWRQYASSFWDDIRGDRVLPFRGARDSEDEKHVHPLQLDVIERCIVLRTNPGEIVFTPFMGVGSECYGAVINKRLAVGIELKESYYAQALKNMAMANKEVKQNELF